MQHTQSPGTAGLMGLVDHLWLKITTHLPLRDFAALAATCRDAWKRPLARAELPAMSAYAHVNAMQRAVFVANRCSDLTSLSVSMDTEVLMGIWAMAAITKRLPHLQQLSIDPLGEPRVVREEQAGDSEEDMEDEEDEEADYDFQQSMAAQALLQTFSSIAPRITELRLSSCLLPQVRAFSMLRHLTVGLFSADDTKQLCELTALETLRVNARCSWFQSEDDTENGLQLQSLTDLKHFSFSGNLPPALRLPAGCRGHLSVVASECCSMSVKGFFPAISSWLSTLDLLLGAVPFSGAIPSSLEDRLLRLDVRVETVTLLMTADLGSRLTPFKLHRTAHCLITQATNFSLVCKSAWLEVPGDTRVAWQRAKFLADGKLSVSYDVVPLPHEVLMFELPIKHLQESNLPSFLSEWSGAAQSSRHEASMAGYTYKAEQQGAPPQEICRILFCRDRMHNAHFLETPQCIQALWPSWRTAKGDE